MLNNMLHGKKILVGAVVLAGIPDTIEAFAQRTRLIPTTISDGRAIPVKPEVSQVVTKPDLEATGFSLRNAAFFANLSTTAYMNEAEARKIVQGKMDEGGLGYDRFDWFEIDSAISEKRLVFDNIEDTEAFIAANDDAIVVVFRGTAGKSDWATDFKFTPSRPPACWNVPNGVIHHGFNQGVTSVWESHGMVQTIRELYNDPTKKKRKLYLAGHSLGAALATVAAARLVYEENMVIDGMYTIGSPRVFDCDMAKSFNEKINGGVPLKSKYFRAKNNNDIVTRVPPYPLYRHVGTEIYFDRFGVINTASCLDRVLGRLKALTRFEITDGVNDHSGAMYVELFHRAFIDSKKSVMHKTKDLLVQGAQKITSLPPKLSPKSEE